MERIKRRVVVWGLLCEWNIFLFSVFCPQLPRDIHYNHSLGCRLAFEKGDEIVENKQIGILFKLSETWHKINWPTFRLAGWMVLSWAYVVEWSDSKVLHFFCTEGMKSFIQFLYKNWYKIFCSAPYYIELFLLISTLFCFGISSMMEIANLANGAAFRRCQGNKYSVPLPPFWGTCSHY